MSELKPLPCPFCGERDAVKAKIHVGNIVECENCGASGPYPNDGAVTAWNTRKPPKDKIEFPVYCSKCSGVVHCITINGHMHIRCDCPIVVPVFGGMETK